MTQITFQVDTSRVLEILSKQIYDSPYAMARENVQNAYDAVLMRANIEQKSPSEYQIVITARSDQIEIADQGIGMTEEVLRENFWRAGSSGKNNDAARAAGVIGTFGIGAMANFGVCDRLQIDTRAIDQDRGIRTFALKSQLSIGQDCISLENIDSTIEVGTKLTAQISPTSPIDVQALRNYLAPFVRFITVPVWLNGELLSQQDVRSAAGIGTSWRVLDTKQLNSGRFAFEACVLADGNQVAVIIDKLAIDGKASSGGAWLRHGVGQVMGLRSRFGLAPIPLPGHYQLGGFADLPFLLPTAGREALTRESIQEATQLVSPIELAITDALKDTDLADTLQAFQQYILQIGRIDWAGRVSIQLSPGDQRMELGKLRAEHPGVELHWYTGTDADQINTFASEDSPLIRVSQTNPRREVQQRYLRDILQLPEIPNEVSIVETYSPGDLSFDEVALMLAIARVLRVDYLIDDIDIQWVRLSHGVPMLTDMTAEKLTLKISRIWSAVQAVIQVVASTPEVVDGMTRDFVRVHIYDRIKAFVPSSQRAGLDALQKTLARRRELYRLEVDDKGELEPLLAEYLAGHVQFSEVLNAATRVNAGHTQRVSSDAVGTVENTLNDVVNAAVEPQTVRVISAPEPGSPILRTDTELRERLLTTGREIPQLNNHRVFLALSDRLFQLEREFFTFPHSTQVAWAGRRIVFLFGLSHSAENLYYDIELRGARSAGAAGGTPLITTTIVTKNRIFVPIPAALVECFTVATDPIEFYVRFDRLLHK